MVTLLHTNRTLDFFLFVAVQVVSGKDHECPVLYALVKRFVETVGQGVMKRLILDRGFLDGQAISICKEQYGIDILIPIRRNMDLYADARALFQESDVHWVECQPPRKDAQESIPRKPKAIAQREKKRQEKLRQLKQQQPPPPPKEILIKKEAAAIGEFRSWSSCTVPLTVVANRESRETRDRWSSRDLVLNRHEEGSAPKPDPAGVPSASLNRGAVSSTQVL